MSFLKNSFLYLWYITVIALTTSCSMQHVEPVNYSTKTTIQDSVTDSIGAQIFASRITKQEIEKMCKIGIKFVRLSFRDHVIMHPSKVSEGILSPDKIMALLKKNNINVLLTLFSNPSTKPKTKTTEEIQNFLKYAQVMTKRYGKQVKYFEIWNEPDLLYSRRFWIPYPQPEKYADLALQTCKAIKEIDPNAKVVGPALAHPPGTKEATALRLFLGAGYLETLVDKDVFKCLDAVTIHPYTEYPENLPKIYSDTRAVIGHNIPIISGELGWSSYMKNGVIKMSPALQADYFIRRILIDHKEHVTPSIWYQWQSNGNNPKEREHGFGMLDFDRSNTPIITVLQEFYQSMKGYSFDYDIPCGEDNYVWNFKNGKKQKLAIWNGKNNKVKLSINKIDIDIGSRPVFIDVPYGEVSCRQMN